MSHNCNVPCLRIKNIPHNLENYLERLLQYSANKASREWTKEKEEAARTAKEQEVADRRKAAAAKAALTKERKAAKAAAEAEAAKEAAELRQQLKAARKERRASDRAIVFQRILKSRTVYT